MSKSRLPATGRPNPTAPPRAMEGEVIELFLISLIALAVIALLNKNRPPSTLAMLAATIACAATAYQCHRQAKRVRLVAAEDGE